MSTQKTVMVGDVPFGGDNPIAFIMGPCQLENRDHAMMMAERVANACAPTGSKFVFKTSYDKANRSSITSARGIGMDEGLRILGEVRDTFSCPVITDVHEVSHCAPAAEVVDVIQIPAFIWIHFASCICICSNLPTANINCFQASFCMLYRMVS